MTDERKQKIGQLAKHPLTLVAAIAIVATTATSPLFAESAVKIIGAIRGCAPCPCATPSAVPPAPVPASTPASDENPELEELGDGVPT